MADDDLQFSSYSQLCMDARLYDESLMYEEAQMFEDNLPYGDWFSFDINSNTIMAGTPELCDSQPVSQSGGSEGGSEASSPATPTSTDSFFAHQTSPATSSSYFPSYASASTPASSAYSSPDATPSQEVASPSESPTFASSGRDYPVCCLHPGCDAKPFKRRADLDRHYKHKHAPSSQKDSYHCDYARCGRRRDPFHRRDHFRDHLRDFHKEDIEKRGVAAKEDWFEGRNASHTWWRCTKCLKRVYISRQGYECPTCKTSLQAKRKEIRRRE
ncbi:hypothetical protein M419DRAFT_89548 [Trichoderma reesei RUT C-30]|uniref:C2H2-type domain-containing protein n=1 Tax=Hypocrea jecorina (strain ATCC 56765 / BCRC 32924 / NRRL 11460 / Rut C-30) TaxID=1344414 RepID=A0A024RYI8_HYPJR|nr:hypothetical protein M419DRAFT_89548 [Trichoderma reesei RUT C-30]